LHTPGVSTHNHGNEPCEAGFFRVPGHFPFERRFFSVSSRRTCRYRYGTRRSVGALELFTDLASWGGLIGLHVAARHSDRIERLVIGIARGWPVNGDIHFAAFSRVMSGPLRKFGIRPYNIFVNGFIPAGINRRRVDPEI
jgi:pimeloyl-ACP methyl ester carboxylesterase